LPTARAYLERPCQQIVRCANMCVCQRTCQIESNLPLSGVLTAGGHVWLSVRSPKYRGMRGGERGGGVWGGGGAGWVRLLLRVEWPTRRAVCQSKLAVRSVWCWVRIGGASLVTATCTLSEKTVMMRTFTRLVLSGQKSSTPHSWRITLKYHQFSHVLPWISSFLRASARSRTWCCSVMQENKSPRNLHHPSTNTTNHIGHCLPSSHSTANTSYLKTHPQVTSKSTCVQSKSVDFC
jgi:hypothetical protein